MSREIKFRAWSKFREEMVDVRGLAISDLGEQFDLVDDSTLGQLASHDWNDLDNYVLMQYTGLKDKNGKEIWEKDRFKHGKAVGTIEYNEDRFEIVWDKPDVEFFNEILRFHVGKGEVIGNIYEEVSKDEDTTSRESSPDEAEDKTSAAE
jgi:uncharacterized phage protein (TIGR01671 family)